MRRRLLAATSAFVAGVLASGGLAAADQLRNDGNTDVLGNNTPAITVTMAPGGQQTFNVGAYVVESGGGTVTFPVTVTATDEHDPAALLAVSPPSGTVSAYGEVAAFKTVATVTVPAGTALCGTTHSPKIRFRSSASGLSGNADTTGVTQNFSITVAGGSCPTATTTADTAAPAVTCTPSQSDGVWHADNVSVTCTATDATGVRTGDASFTLSTSVSAGAETATAETGSREVCDTVSPEPNCTLAGPIAGWMIDRKAPTEIAMNGLPGSVVLGSSPSPSCTATDGGSGLASCAVTGVDTSSVGAKTATATATDNVGNADSVTHAYSVLFGDCAGGTARSVGSPFKSNAVTTKVGSTVPVKIRVCDAAGTAVGTGPVVTSFVGGSPNPIPTNTFTAFRYDAGDGHWIYNLSTRGLSPNSSYAYSVGLADGTSVRFTVHTR